MKRYFIGKGRNTEYDLMYSETLTDELVRLNFFPQMKQISSKEAESFCIAERTRQKEDHDCSSRGPTVIRPFEFWTSTPEFCVAYYGLRKRRYCLERPKKKN